MPQRITALYKLITIPTFYRALMFALGADKALTRYVGILGLRPGMRMLDVGCGPGNLLPYLTEVDYTGIDLNEKHIVFARERYGATGRFLVGNAAADLPDEKFDVISMIGLLHHLSDEECSKTMAGIRTLLKPNGRIVTLDPVWLPRQRLVCRTLNYLDSGLNIRTPEQYRHLASGFDVECSTYGNFLRIPYDHCCMVLSL